jgi:tetratricopeptide (TPR) repeat protein
VSWFVAAASLTVVAVVRPRAAEHYHGLHVTADVYGLPAPDQVVAASLGYRAALADELFADLLVTYGIHLQEKRRFEFVGNYIDTINALDPTFRPPYRFADTLLVYGAFAAREKDYVKAREIFERGLRNRPDDAELWNTAGQFTAYLAPSWLPESVRPEWRQAGAKMMARACELPNSNENIPYQCISAARIFDGAGERDAAIRALERLLAVTEDPEIEQLALGYLGARLSEREKAEQDRRRTAFREIWKGDLPFVTKDMMLIVGPKVNVAACAGPEHGETPDCTTSFLDWGRRLGAVLESAAPDESAEGR